MTSLLQHAHELMDRMPEDKLPFLIQLMREVIERYEEYDKPEVSEAERMAAFDQLEQMRKSIPRETVPRQKAEQGDSL